MATACFTSFDFHGSGRTSLVWWDHDTHQWLEHDPQHLAPVVLAAGASEQSEGLAGDFDGNGVYDPAIVETTIFGPTIYWGAGAGAVPLALPPAPELGSHPCNRDGKHTPFPVFGAYDAGHKTTPAFYVAQDVWRHIYGHDAFAFGRPMRTDGLPDWDLPVVGDYDGDGITDVAVYNPSSGEWIVRQNGQPVVIATWGGHGATPLPAD